MKIKELIKSLEVFDDELDVSAVCSWTEHCCGDEACYCSDAEHKLYISSIATHQEINRKTKKQEIKGVVFQMELE